MKKTRRIPRPFFTSVKTVNWSPVSLLIITTVIAVFYVAMEWVFIFTRPSFLQTVAFLEKSRAFSSSAGLLVLACLVILLPLLVLGSIIKNTQVRKAISWIAFLLPALLLTSLALLLLDNFSYTIFHFGIVSTSGITRGIYSALLIVALVFFYTRLIEFNTLLSTFFSRWKLLIRLALIGVITTLAVMGSVLTANLSDLKNEMVKQQTASSRNQLPDIILITVDAVNAEYTSIYGGERDTTPFLRELAGESLLGLNHFANAQGTIGSLTSLLTGRHPADVRVIYSSDMLQATNAYQHLPGILNAYGYYTVQLSNAQYADAYKTNFQSAFDSANGRGATDQPVNSALNRLYPGVTAIFQNEVIERISSRVLHVFFIRDMNNPYQEVTEAPQKFDDIEKIRKLKSLLDEKREPLFIHIHWMGTHGPNYYPEEQIFSKGLDVNNQDTDRQLFYYDSIREFDQVIAELHQILEANDRLNHTVLVITSDHSQKWTNSRLPLLIQFPGDEYIGAIGSNTENIDIAPTLLDYLGIPQPEWMPGQSLIAPSYNEHPIFTAKIPKSTRDSVTEKVIYPESVPPFYQFGRMSVVVCSQWFELDLTDKTIKSGRVAAYTRLCDEEITQGKALDLIIEHLERYRFETETLRLLREEQNEISIP